MRHIRFITLLVIFPLLISLSACGKNPEKARKELAQMNIDFTKEEFLKYVERGDTTVVDLFLTAGIDANSKHYYDTPDGRSALYLAACEGVNISILQKLIDKGANINEGWNPSMCAMTEGHIETLKYLLNKGADVNIRSPAGIITPDAAEFLMYLGGDTDWTLLMFAAFKGDAGIVKLLLDKGADVNAILTKTNGSVAMKIAREKGHAEIVKLLKDAGAKE